MATKIMLQHANSGLLREGYYGFSWTFLLFGGIVCFFRREPGYGFAHMAASFLTFGLWNLLFCFLYNRQNLRRMVESGWKLTGTDLEIRSAAQELGLDPTSNSVIAVETSSTKEQEKIPSKVEASETD